MAAESEREKLYAVFMQAPVAICMLEGPEHTFVFANPRYRELVGGREVVGKPLLQALPDVAAQQLDVILDQVVATGESYFGNEVTFKFAHHAADEFAIMNFVYSAKRNSDGVIDGVLVSVIDVTEQVLARRRLETLAELLRDREERLRRVVDASGTGTWELDVHTLALAADPQHRQLYGLPLAGELTQSELLAAVADEDREGVADAMRAAAAGDHHGRFVIEHRTRADRATWLEARGQRIVTGEAAVRLVGTAVDITERKRTSLALADERDKLQAIFQVSPAAMAMWSGPEHVFEKVNPQYQAIFGDRALLDRPLLEAIPELAGQAFPALLTRVLQTGEAHVGREVLTQLARPGDGQLEDHYYDFTYARIDDSQGRPQAVYDHAVDVTERVLARRNLEESEERLKLALSGGQMGSWTITFPDWKMLSDERFRELHGAITSASIDEALCWCVHPDDHERIRASMRLALEQGVPYACEYRARRADGSERWTYARGELRYDASGKPASISGVAFDIDDRRRAEQMREQLLSELQHAQVIEQQLRLEAEHANRSKDEFLAMLGHELRNPLAPIATALQLMKLRAADMFSKERTIIERQVDHLTRLVDDLLDVSRITSGKIEIDKQAVNLATVVANAIEIASPLLEQRSHHLHVDVTTQDLLVDGDPMRLAQVISNLLTNAAKYTEPGGQITISAARKAERVLLRVRDSGVGIAPEMLPRVFEMFAQERQTIERASGGLGLGLAIVRSLVGLHGGSVSAHSAGRGQGSTFTIELPALAADAALQPTRLRDEVRLPAAAQRKILLVDDNVDAAELLAMHLTLLGHETRVAFDGPSALALVADFVPDFAVLDIGLPVMDGYELARQLRASPTLSGLRLVALTGYGQASDRQRSAEAGFDAHIVKPLQFATLEALIAKLT